MKTRNAEGELQVYDSLRRRWVAYTPEEHVRQQFVELLIRELEYPEGRLGNEVSLTLNGMNRRCDTVIYGTAGEPIGIIEYKSEKVVISRKVFEQILRYAIVLKVRWIIVSNGRVNYCAEIIPGQPPTLRFHPTIPNYPSLIS